MFSLSGWLRGVRRTKDAAAARASSTGGAAAPALPAAGARTTPPPASVARAAAPPALPKPAPTATEPPPSPLEPAPALEPAPFSAPGGPLVAHVSDSEAAALAALASEGGRDIVLAVVLAQTLLFSWRDWEERDPCAALAHARRKTQPGIWMDRFSHRTAGSAVTAVRTTAAVVRQALTAAPSRSRGRNSNGGADPDDGGDSDEGETLALDNRQLSDAGVAWICEALAAAAGPVGSARRFAGPTVVDLSFNAATGFAAQRLAHALRWLPLKALYLGRNNLGDDGARAIAGLIVSNTWLVRVNLSDNRIGDEGLAALAAAAAAVRVVPRTTSDDPFICGAPSDGEDSPSEPQLAPRLELLSLRGNPRITQRGVNAALEVMTAGGCAIAHADFRGCSLDKDCEGVFGSSYAKRTTYHATAVF